MEEDAPEYIRREPEALNAFIQEKTSPYGRVIRSWKMAIFWSVLFSVTIIGEGYDLALMGNFFSLRQFQDLFGRSHGPGLPREIPALWQSGMLCAALAGQLIGIYFTGHSVDRYGHRKTVIFALGQVMVFLLIGFFSPTVIPIGGSDAGLGMLFVGELLMGVPWGVFQATTLAYSSEIAPAKLRPTLTTFINMCWIFGQLFSTAANKAVTRLDSNLLAFRIPLMVQWLWPVPVAVGAFIAPESPWWLIRQGRSEDARRSLRRLNRQADFPLEGHIRVMELTNEHERDSLHSPAAASRTSSIASNYADCFHGINRRRTEIVVMLNLTQQLCGSCLMFYSAKLYQKGGIAVEQAYDYTLVQYGLGLVAIACSWAVMQRVCRRATWLGGLGAAALLMAAIGALGFFRASAAGVPWVIAALLIVFTGVYNLTLGPLTYSLVSEMSSTRLKAKTVVIGRACYLVAGLFNLFLTPKMLEDTPNGWGLGPQSALVFAGWNAVFFAWAFFRLPETKGRSFAELDVLFKRGVSARDFGKTVLTAPGAVQAQG
ncbi:maltose permease MAL61 [Verticillium dahliae]|nr:maltose permease MAL61 [Verticillium dahliae]